MADATFNDLLAELKSVNKSIKDSSGESATGRAKESEQAAERKVYDEALLGTLKSIQETLGKNFKAVSSGDKKSGGLIAGLLGGIGSAVGAVFKAVAKIGVGFAVGMGALGAGIAAFLLALKVGDSVAGLLSFVGEGENLKTLIQNFFGAFSPETALMMGGIIGLSILAGKLKVTPLEMAGGMTAIGAGIAGFFGGILLADGLAKLGDMAGLNGASLATLISNFTGAFASQGAAGVSTLVAILGVGALSALVPGNSMKSAGVNALKIAAGMTGLGFGIAGFFLGVMAGDGIAKLGQMISLDGKSLSTLIGNFVSAFASQGAAGVGVLVSLLGVGALTGLIGAVPIAGAVAAGGAALGIAAGMTAIGMGIAGFAFGLLSADGISRLGEMAGLDGKSLGKLIDNFVTAFASSKTRMAVLAGLLAVGALGAFNPAAGPGIAAALTSLGLGIAGFVGGFLLGDLAAKFGEFVGLDGKSFGNLLENIGSGIGRFLGSLGAGAVSALNDVDPDRLGKLGKGIADLGVGILAFATGSAVGGAAGVIGGAIDAIKGLFGFGKEKSPLEKIADFAARKDINVPRLKELGIGVFHLGKGLQAFAAVDPERVQKNIDAIAGGTFSKGLGDLSNQDMKLLTSMSMNQMSAGLAGGGEAGTIINNDNRTITIQNAPQLTNITGQISARR